MTAAPCWLWRTSAMRMGGNQVQCLKSSSVFWQMGYAALWRAHLRAPIAGGGAGEPANRPPVPDQVNFQSDWYDQPRTNIVSSV